MYSRVKDSQLNLSDTNRANVSFYIERKHLKYLWKHTHTYILSTISAYNKLIHALFIYVKSREWRGNKSVEIETSRIYGRQSKCKKLNANFLQ